MGQNVQQKVKVGDWIILATDGLYDNVPDSEIVARVSASTDVTALAEELGDLATQRSMDKTYVSPFMKAAIGAKVDWQGGKPDDITIVALKVVDDPQTPRLTLLSTLPEAADA